MTYNALNAARSRIQKLLETAEIRHQVAVSNGMKQTASIREAQVVTYRRCLEIVNEEIANVSMLKAPEALL